jgi:hypothetical protein
VNDVALDFIFFFQNRFERVAARRFDKTDGGVKFAVDGFLLDDFGVADLIFLRKRTDGLLELFVFAEQIVDGFSSLKECSGHKNEGDQRQQSKNCANCFSHGSTSNN